MKNKSVSKASFLLFETGYEQYIDNTHNLKLTCKQNTFCTHSTKLSTLRYIHTDKHAKILPKAKVKYPQRNTLTTHINYVHTKYHSSAHYTYYVASNPINYALNQLFCLRQQTRSYHSRWNVRNEISYFSYKTHRFPGWRLWWMIVNVGTDTRSFSVSIQLEGNTFFASVKETKTIQPNNVVFQMVDYKIYTAYYIFYSFSILLSYEYRVMSWSPAYHIGMKPIRFPSNKLTN